MASEFKKLTVQQLAELAPVTKEGKPDLYNTLPSRFISKGEAEARGWSLFYVGDVCSHGHKAPRFVSNPRLCVDCKRLREGRLPIGGKGEAEYTARVRPYSERTAPSTSTNTAVVPRPLEPDAIEKKFLTEYAKVRDFDTAANNLFRDPAEFHGRISYTKVFREAVNFLEDQLGLNRTVSMTEDFEWTDDKRIVLIRTYINTGDLVSALKSIGVSNWHYETELQTNPEFATAISEAEPLALKILDRTAISQAIRGDSRLLQRVLVAKIPEYSERVKVDLNVTDKLTEDQLNVRLLQALEQAGVKLINAPAIDAEFTVHESLGKDEAVGNGGDEQPQKGPKSNLDLL